jgi:hypothetical protein
MRLNVAPSKPSISVRIRSNRSNACSDSARVSLSEAAAPCQSVTTCSCSVPDEEYITEYFRTLTEALEWISEQTGRKVISEEEVTKLDEELTAQDEDAYCYINEVQVA